MNPNEETLTTRDLASRHDSVAATVTEPETDDRQAVGGEQESSLREQEQEQEPAAGATGSYPPNGAGEPLLAAEASQGFQRRWEQVQTRFVDEPRGAVEEADGLVANVMQRLAEDFAQERERLEAQWGRGEDISTEDLRVALQRYRSFFQRLLSA